MCYYKKCANITPKTCKEFWFKRIHEFRAIVFIFKVTKTASLPVFQQFFYAKDCYFSYIHVQCQEKTLIINIKT